MKSSNLALGSVNLITSTIKSTLQKGNSLIRPQNKQSLSKTRSNQKAQTSQIFPTSQQEQLSAVKLYEKLKPYAQNEDKIKKNLINILNYAELKWTEFHSISNKTGYHYNQYSHKFNMIQRKLNQNLNKLINDGNIDQINNIKLQIKSIVQFLNQRARKFVDKNKQIVNLVKKKQKQQIDEESQQQAIKEEMLDLLDRLKGQALNIGSDLKKDNVVIGQIQQKQNKQINVLEKKSSSLDEIISSQRLGFFNLIFLAAIAIIAWIFTLLFILIF